MRTSSEPSVLLDEDVEGGIETETSTVSTTSTAASALPSEQSACVTSVASLEGSACVLDDVLVGTEESSTDAFADDVACDTDVTDVTDGDAVKNVCTGG